MSESADFQTGVVMRTEYRLRFIVTNDDGRLVKLCTKVLPRESALSLYDALDDYFVTEDAVVESRSYSPSEWQPHTDRPNV